MSAAAFRFYIAPSRDAERVPATDEQAAQLRDRLAALQEQDGFELMQRVGAVVRCGDQRLMQGGERNKR